MISTCDEARLGSGDGRVGLGQSKRLGVLEHLVVREADTDEREPVGGEEARAERLDHLRRQTVHVVGGREHAVRQAVAERGAMQQLDQFFTFTTVTTNILAKKLIWPVDRYI